MFLHLTLRQRPWPAALAVSTLACCQHPGRCPLPLRQPLLLPCKGDHVVVHGFDLQQAAQHHIRDATKFATNKDACMVAAQHEGASAAEELAKWSACCPSDICAQCSSERVQRCTPEKGSTAAAANRAAKQAAHTRGRLLHSEAPLPLGHPPACVQKPAADHQACLKGCRQHGTARCCFHHQAEAGLRCHKPSHCCGQPGRETVSCCVLLSRLLAQPGSYSRSWIC